MHMHSGNADGGHFARWWPECAGWVVALALVIGTGCIVIPLPLNRPDPATRHNVRGDTGSDLAVGQVTRAEVLLRLGEPDVVSADERRFRYHTERVKWDLLWAVGAYGSGAAGDREIKKYFDLVLEFDPRGTLTNSVWVAGFNPQKLREENRWRSTNTPPVEIRPVGPQPVP